ncbi:MAG TPA: Ig-like domain-containing protein, partial [Gemmatimonadaceae bacterium]
MRRLHWVVSSAVLLLALPAIACIDTAAPTFESPVLIAAITVQPAEATTNVGKLLPLSALVLDPSGHQLDGQDIIWSSSDTSVATVSESGEVKAKRIGSSVIIATDGTKAGTATLTVLAPQVASVSLSPASAELLAGDTTRFAAEPRDDEAQPIEGRSVNWSVANPTIAKVAGGVLVGLAA